MATLTLTKTFINLAATGDAVSAWRASGEDSDSVAVEGRVGTYAGGRQRSFTVEGVAGTHPFTLVLVPEADCLTLRSWLGETVLYRDNIGRKMWGTLFEDTRTPYPDRPGYYSVALTLRTVDFDEGV